MDTLTAIAFGLADVTPASSPAPLAPPPPPDLRLILGDCGVDTLAIIREAIGARDNHEALRVLVAAAGVEVQFGPSRTTSLTETCRAAIAEIVRTEPA